MRGQINRRGIQVTGEEETVFGLETGAEALASLATYTASFRGSLLTGPAGERLETIDLSFTRPTYDGALGALLNELAALDIKVASRH